MEVEITEEKLRTAKYAYWFKNFDTIFFVFADSDKMLVYSPRYSKNSSWHTEPVSERFLNNNVSDKDFIPITIDEAIKKFKNEENLEYMFHLDGGSWWWEDIYYDKDSNTFVIDSYHDSSIDSGDITHSRERGVSLNKIISKLKSANKYGEHEIGCLKEIFGEDFENKEDAMQILRKKIIKEIQNHPSENYEIASLFWEDAASCFPTNYNFQWDGAFFYLDLRTGRLFVKVSTYPNPACREDSFSLTAYRFNEIAKKYNMSQELQVFETEKDWKLLFDEQLRAVVSEMIPKLQKQKNDLIEDKQKDPLLAVYIPDKLQNRPPKMNLIGVTLDLDFCEVNNTAKLIQKNGEYHIIFEKHDLTDPSGNEKYLRKLMSLESVWIEEQVENVLKDRDESLYESDNTMNFAIERTDGTGVKHKGEVLKKYSDLMFKFYRLAKYGSKESVVSVEKKNRQNSSSVQIKETKQKNKYVYIAVCSVYLCLCLFVIIFLIIKFSTAEISVDTDVNNKNSSVENMQSDNKNVSKDEDYTVDIKPALRSYTTDIAYEKGNITDGVFYSEFASLYGRLPEGYSWMSSSSLDEVLYSSEYPVVWECGAKGTNSPNRIIALFTVYVGQDAEFKDCKKVFETLNSGYKFEFSSSGIIIFTDMGIDDPEFQNRRVYGQASATNDSAGITREFAFNKVNDRLVCVMSQYDAGVTDKHISVFCEY